MTGNVSVRPEVVLYAIRYTMGRATYASTDGAALCIEHADLIREHGWADVTIRDINSMLAHPHPLASRQECEAWERARDALAVTR